MNKWKMKIKYNEQYDRYVTEDGVVFRYNSKRDELILCKQRRDKDGYMLITVCKPSNKPIRVHRLVYEIYVGVIPNGYVIDHIDTDKENNNVSNLKCCTVKDNINNPLTLEKHKHRTYSDFAKKFKEKFGITCCDDYKLYHREQAWYLRHNHKCRWE